MADEGAYERPTAETRTADMKHPYDIIKRNVGGNHVSQDQNVDYLTVINTNSDIYLSPVGKLECATPLNTNSNVYNDISNDGSHLKAFDSGVTSYHDSFKHDSLNSNYVDIDVEENIYDRIADDASGDKVTKSDPESATSERPQCSLVRVVAIILSVFLAVAIVVIAVPVWLHLNNNNKSGPGGVVSTTVGAVRHQTTFADISVPAIVAESTRSPEHTTRALEARSTRDNQFTTMATTPSYDVTTDEFPKETTSTVSVDVTTTPRAIPTTVPTTRGCGDGWDRHGDHCYKFVSEIATWEDSRADCSSRGAHLLTIDTSKELFFLQNSYVPRYGPITPYWEFWLGGRYEDGSWRWITTNDAIDEDWQSWSYNGPDYHEAGDCLTYRIRGDSTYDMFDLNCAHRRPYVCEHLY